MAKIKQKTFKAWALIEDGELCHYYSLAYITFTKGQAIIERNSKNYGVFNHHMKVKKIRITIDE